MARQKAISVKIPTQKVIKDAFEDRWLPIGGLELAVVLVPASVVAIFVLAVSVVARREVEAASPQGGRVAVRMDLGRGPWWVVTSGLLALVPAVMLGAPAWTPELADPFGSMQLLRSVVVLALPGVWPFLATRWPPETPAPKPGGRGRGACGVHTWISGKPAGAPTYTI